jgi:Zn-finger nucleic acid-binding protein
MECPKCSGGSFLSEEELVKVIEGSEPPRMVLRAIYTCRACQEKFSRLVWDELGPHRRHVQAPPGQYQPQAPNPYQYQQPQQQAKREEEVVEGLKFF